VVAQQPVQRGSFSLGRARSTGIVILLHRAGRAGPFEVVADVRGGHAAHHALHPVAVAIIHKRGAGRPRYRNHAVLGVIGVIGGAAGDLLRHVAVGVVTEDCAHHSPLILRSQLPDATRFSLLTFKTVSTFFMDGVNRIYYMAVVTHSELGETIFLSTNHGSESIK